MDPAHRPTVAPICLVAGALLGLAGTFAQSETLRGLAWSLDGTALVVAGALLAVHYLRRGEDLVAAGFVVFAVGQSHVLSSAGRPIATSGPQFASGAILWAAALAMISAAKVMPGVVRVLGLIACALFAWTSLQVFGGADLTPLSEPLPFFAYPFLVLTMFGWAWSCRQAPATGSIGEPGGGPR